MAKIESKEIKPTTMRIPLELRQRVKQQAIKENRSETNMTIVLLNDALARRRTKPTGGTSELFT